MTNAATVSSVRTAARRFTPRNFPRSLSRRYRFISGSLERGVDRVERSHPNVVGLRPLGVSSFEASIERRGRLRERLVVHQPENVFA